MKQYYKRKNNNHRLLHKFGVEGSSWGFLVLPSAETGPNSGLNWDAQGLGNKLPCSIVTNCSRCKQDYCERPYAPVPCNWMNLSRWKHFWLRLIWQCIGYIAELQKTGNRISIICIVVAPIDLFHGISQAETKHKNLIPVPQILVSAYKTRHRRSIRTD